MALRGVRIILLRNTRNFLTLYRIGYWIGRNETLKITDFDQTLFSCTVKDKGPLFLKVVLFI